MVYPQLSNSQIVIDQQHQQQNQAYTCIQPPDTQQSLSHSNTSKQQVLSSSHHSLMGGTVPTNTLMSNPTVSSTPVSAQTKRGRNDTSGVSESNVRLRPQFPQSTRIFNSSISSNKRVRRTNQQTNEGIYLDHYGQNHPVQLNQNENDNLQQPSTAACRLATTRYPFSPYSVIFMQEVREKIVVDDLIKHASDNLNFELKTVAYRKGRSENNDHRVLIFVENSESFAFLYDKQNWPNMLAGGQFSIKSPSIPPQLSLVLPIVPLHIGWDDFVQELKDKYPNIVDIIRLKNKA
jgi:hypothetical protein